jgi:hypothetical protein
LAGAGAGLLVAIEEFITGSRVQEAEVRVGDP